MMMIDDTCGAMCEERREWAIPSLFFGVCLALPCLALPRLILRQQEGGRSGILMERTRLEEECGKHSGHQCIEERLHVGRGEVKDEKFFN